MTYEWIVVLCPFMIWAMVPFTMWRESRRAKEVGNVANREKSGKVNESQIDFLKPCPFCGKKLHRYEENGEWVIECLTKGCLMICGPLCKKDAMERMLEVRE